MNNPLKYTDPTGYQTAPAPGAVSWFGGGGGWGNVGLHWSHYTDDTSKCRIFSRCSICSFCCSIGIYHCKIPNFLPEIWNYNGYYMPNVFSDPTYYYYDSQGYYHKATYFGGDEIVSFDQVMDEYILPNGADITYLVKKSIKLGKKGIDIPFIYKDSFGSTGYGVGDKWVSWQKLVAGANTGNGGSAGGDKGAERESQTNIEFKVNNAIDNTVTLTSGSVYGAQKMAGIAARDMTRLTTLTVIGRVTGGLSIYYNSKLYFQNPKQNWWNGVEAAGQFAAIVIGYATGIEEVELVYNLTTFTIDMGRMSMEKYKQEHP